MMGERDGKGKVIADWKGSRGPRQLELVFWRPPFPVARRAQAYQRGIGGDRMIPRFTAQA